MSKDISIIIHGGAGGWENADDSLIQSAMSMALEQGWEALASGLSAQEAVVKAINILEDDPQFDAGYGSFPNEDGLVFMDVGMMHGDGRFAAAMNLSHIRYPSRFALDLFKHHDYIQLVWTEKMLAELSQADAETQKRYGYEADRSKLIAPSVSHFLAQKPKTSRNYFSHGTVGCVAKDQNGKICACTSTGGTPLKPDGRIGDSPIVGAGFFANNDIGGLSTTGHGELILSSLVSPMVISEMKANLKSDSNHFEKSVSALESILRAKVAEFSIKFPGKDLGLIVLPLSGIPQFAFSAKAMAVARRSADNHGNLLIDEAGLVRA